MMRAFRRFSARHGLNLMLAFIVLGIGVSLWNPQPAAADTDADIAKLKSVALSGVGLSQKLMALNELKLMDSTAATDALADIASRAKLQVASAACAQLGRVHSSRSKAKLKALLETSTLDVKVRMAAASCIAEHWKDDGDISYLEGRCAGNTALAAHCEVVKQRVYGQ